MVYVSITGLRIRSWRQVLPFWWHAIRSMTQARTAPGCLRAESRTINGVQHTLTIWRDEAAMRAFLASGAHREAMRAFRRIATGKTFGFSADKAPDWDQVHVLWQERGREY